MGKLPLDTSNVLIHIQTRKTDSQYNDRAGANNLAKAGSNNITITNEIESPIPVTQDGINANGFFNSIKFSPPSTSDGVFRNLTVQDTSDNVVDQDQTAFKLHGFYNESHRTEMYNLLNTSASYNINEFITTSDPGGGDPGGGDPGGGDPGGGDPGGGGGGDPGGVATYVLARSKTKVNEGESFTITLATTNISDGTNVPYTITGVDSTGINGISTTGNFVVLANMATLNIQTTVDADAADATFILRLDGRAETVQVPINDTTGDSYTLTSSSTSVGEGSPFTITLTTTNIPNGTIVPYTITGVDSADISNANLTGSFVINSSTSSVTINTANVNSTKAFTLRLDDHTDEFVSVNINNTSIGGPNVELYELLSTANSVTEGDSLTITLATTGVDDGVSVPYTISGISSSDINNTNLTGNFVIAGSQASLALQITDDGITEGTETMSINLTNKGVNLPITISDTAPTYTLSTPVNNVDEGEGFTITLTTTNVLNNTTIPYLITGVDTEDINNAPTTGNFVVNNDRATLSIQTTADQTTEGGETFSIRLIDHTNVTLDVTINDTSLDAPTYSLSSSPTSVDEGQQFVVTLTTANVSDGTAVPYTITGVNSSDIGGANLTGNLTIGNNTGSITFTTSADSLNDGEETFKLTLITGEYVDVTINDTSTNPNGTGNEVDPPSVSNPSQGTGAQDVENLEMVVKIGPQELSNGGYLGEEWSNIGGDQTNDGYFLIENVEVGINMINVADAHTGSNTFEQVYKQLPVYQLSNIEAATSIRSNTSAVNTYNIWDPSTQPSNRLAENYVEDTYWDVELTGASDPFTQTIYPELTAILASLP